MLTRRIRKLVIQQNIGYFLVLERAEVGDYRIVFTVVNIFEGTKLVAGFKDKVHQSFEASLGSSSILVLRQCMKARRTWLIAFNGLLRTKIDDRSRIRVQKFRTAMSSTNSKS